MIIDFHVHALPPSVKQDRSKYLARDAAFASIYSGDKVKIATAEDIIASMDREGIDVSVIVNYSWTTHNLCVETNDYILESITRYSKRLYGFCGVSSLTEDYSLKEIERCAKAGVKGIGELRPDLQPLDYTQQDVIKPLADITRKYRLMVMTHSSEPVGHIYPGKGQVTPAMLMSFIDQFTDVPVICAHWGGGLPFYTLMPEVRTALENVYFDTAASPLLYRPEIYKQAEALVGADRILFGTDFPVMTQGRVLEQIREAELTEESKKEILCDNARRLLKI